MLVTRGSVAIVCVLLALGCSSLRATNSIDEWVARSTDKDEQILCKRDIGGEYFFVAQSGDRIKLGSRLDMSEYPQSHAFLVSWVLRNEANESPFTKERPVPVFDRYVRSAEKVFAESVEYRTLRPPRPSKIVAQIDVKKCPSSECDRRQAKSKDEKQYVVKLCEASLR
jgi:hypothetical protein